MTVTHFTNAVLARLSSKARAALDLHPVTLTLEQLIYEANQPAEWVYFPEVGVISIVSIFIDGRTVEVQTVGRESISGTFLLLDTDSVPFRAFVQVPGNGYRASATRFLELAESDRQFRSEVLKAEARLRVQSMQNCACNGMHSVEQRCSRWLLMAEDRSDSNEVKLTHEFLAAMLGVRRASVSEVLRPFHDRGLIRASRGSIAILNRAELEKISCECYSRITDRELNS